MLPVDVVGRADGLDQPLGKADRRVHLADGALQDDEFVTAEPDREIVRPEGGREAARDGAEQAVADPVAQRIVDGLEAVEIDIVESRAGARFDDERLEPPVQQDPVRQTGQRIMVGHVVKPRGHALAVGHILDDADQISDRVIRTADDRQLLGQDGAQFAVAAGHRLLGQDLEPALGDHLRVLHLEAGRLLGGEDLGVRLADDGVPAAAHQHLTRPVVDDVAT